MLSRKDVTAGADPEVFLFDGDTPVPGIGLIGGTKEEPQPVKFGAVQEDNVLAEFNIDPAKSQKEFLRNLDMVMRQLAARVAPLQLKVQASQHFTKEALMAAGPQAIRFGCDPDYNAWTQEVNETPSPFTTLRSAGGHVHLGFDLTKVDPFSVARSMDIFLGIPSVLLDDNTERRSIYGKAGSCRPKPYGVEYRTLSNFWLRSNVLMRWVYDNAMLAYEKSDEVDEILDIFPAATIQDTINTSNREMAENMVAALNIPMPA